MASQEQHKTPEELLAEMHTISLSVRAREQTREQRADYADFHAINEVVPATVRTGTRMRLHMRGMYSKLFRRPLAVHTFKTLFARHNHTTMFTTLLLALLLSGGTSYAAESAVPGGVLYPIKVEVNERVVGALHVSKEAKARWETELASRRADEAARLAATNTLSADAEVSLRTEIAEHVAHAVTQADSLDEHGQTSVADTVRANVGATLRAHTDILADIAARPHKDSDNEKEGHKPPKEKDSDNNDTPAEADDHDGAPLRSLIAALRVQSEIVAHEQTEARAHSDNAVRGTVEIETRDDIHLGL